MGTIVTILQMLSIIILKLSLCSPSSLHGLKHKLGGEVRRASLQHMPLSPLARTPSPSPQPAPAPAADARCLYNYYCSAPVWWNGGHHYTHKTLLTMQIVCMRLIILHIFIL